MLITRQNVWNREWNSRASFQLGSLSMVSHQTAGKLSWIHPSSTISHSGGEPWADGVITLAEAAERCGERSLAVVFPPLPSGFSLFFLTFLERWVKLSQADCSGGKWEQGRLLCSECTQVLIDHRNQICSRRTAPFVTQSNSCESCGHHHLGLVNVTI